VIERRTLVFCAAIAVLLCATSAAVILAQWPPHGWAVAFAHAPRLTRAYLLYWLTYPVLYLSILLATLIGALFVSRGTSTAPGLQRLMTAGLAGIGVVSTLIQAVRLVGLFVSRAQRTAFIAGGGAGHAFVFDPNFIITRISVAAGGLFLLWFGNQMPKQLSPTASADERGQANRRTWRLGGWLAVVGGLGVVACAFVSPIRLSLEMDGVIGMTVIAIWIVLNLIGHRPDGSTDADANP
jgi:hypothetical protein